MMTTHTFQRSGRRRFGAVYPRAMGIDDLPAGGVSASVATAGTLMAWQQPRPWEMRGVIIGGVIRPRLCAVVN